MTVYEFRRYAEMDDGTEVLLGVSDTSWAGWYSWADWHSGGDNHDDAPKTGAIDLPSDPDKVYHAGPARDAFPANGVGVRVEADVSIDGVASGVTCSVGADVTLPEHVEIAVSSWIGPSCGSSVTISTADASGLCPVTEIERPEWRYTWNLPEQDPKGVLAWDEVTHVVLHDGESYEQICSRDGPFSAGDTVSCWSSRLIQYFIWAAVDASPEERYWSTRWFDEPTSCVLVGTQAVESEASTGSLSPTPWPEETCRVQVSF